MGKQTIYTLEAINDRLKASLVPVRLKQRFDRLSLVATLPPRPGSDRIKPYQQVLSLGIPANADGFRRAEAEARRLGSLLALKEFDWSLYQPIEALTPIAAGVLISQFQAHYMATHSLSQSTWDKHWWAVFKRLPQDKPLELTTMMALIDQTDRNTRLRSETCKKLQALADFAKLEVDLLKFQGNYSSSKSKARDVPADSLIVEWRDRIPSPHWQWFYGVLAVYGLRDHEAFFCEFDADRLRVLKGKTGARLVFAPLYPEWVEAWNLKDIHLPPLRLDRGYQYLASQAAAQFRRYGIPFTPYDLRYAYGHRASITFGFPVTTSSALMGHSPEVHNRIYQRFISQSHHLQVSDRIMNQPDRPKPPAASLGSPADDAGN